MATVEKDTPPNINGIKNFCLNVILKAMGRGKYSFLDTLNARKDSQELSQMF